MIDKTRIYELCDDLWAGVHPEGVLMPWTTRRSKDSVLNTIKPNTELVRVKILTLSDYLDWARNNKDRQTGRTTKMMFEVMQYLVKHPVNRVVILVPILKIAEHIKSMYDSRELSNRISFEVCSSNWMVVRSLPSNCKIFMDHTMYDFNAVTPQIESLLK